MKHATVRQNVLEIKTKFYKYYSSCHVAHWFSFKKLHTQKKNLPKVKLLF